METKALRGKQAQFFHMVTSATTPRHCGMFGGFASGKTTVGCMCALHLTLSQPGVTGAIIRNTHPELRTNTRKIFMDLVYEFDAGKSENHKVLKSYNEQYNIAKFSNGSTVYFLHTQSDALYKGPEFGWFLIDQAEEVKEDIVTRITTRLRQPGYLQKGMYLGNTDRGHNWCYRWFKLKQRTNSALVEVSFLDNADNLKGGVLEDLLAYPEDWKKVNLYGSWDSPGGLVIEPGPGHILKPFPIPYKWSYGLAIDPAESTGTCAALFCAVDYSDRYYVCNEYYAKGRMIKDHARGIKEMWAKFCGQNVLDFARVWDAAPPKFVYVDPRSWSKRTAGETGFITISDRYREHGITGSMGINDIEVGIDILRERHEPHPERIHPITGRSPASGIYFFKDNLPNLWDEIFSWMIEEPDKEPCHGVDALRYFVASSPVKPRRPLMVKRIRRTNTYMEM